MRGRLGPWLLASVIGTFHASVRAQGTDGLHVERGVGAEGCPDALGLGERVAAIRGRPQTSSGVNYQVGFRRAADTFSVTIRSGQSAESERVLEGRGNCSALAQATAVTLALLFDSEAERAEESRTAPAPAPALEPEHLSASPMLQVPTGPSVQQDATLSVGVAGLASVLRPWSPAFTGELGLRVGSFRAGVGVLWIPPQSLSLESGQMNVSLLSGTVRACFALARTRSIELGLCSGLFAGAVSAHAEGAGITDNASQTHAYLALPFELSVAELSAPFGWELSAAALAALAHQDFEVEGLPVPYRAPRVGGMLTFRALGLWPW